MTNAQLPPEIWRIIFRHATFEPGLLEKTWDYDPDDRIWDCWGSSECWESRSSDDLRSQRVKNNYMEIFTKQTIIQVCRNWREIGVEFLYESVTIPNDTGRLALLVEVLISSASSGSQTTQGYGWWIKRIHYYDQIMESSDFDHLVVLLEQCHNIEILSTIYDHAEAIPFDRSHNLRLTQILQSRFTHSLRRLELYVTIAGQVNLADVVPEVPLTSLAIKFPARTLDNPLHRSFDHLTTLIIRFPDNTNHFPSDWTLPLLRNLGLLRVSHPHMPFLEPFVLRHQETLTHLHLDFVSPANYAIASLCPFLPRLRSLAFDDMDLVDLGMLNDGKLSGLTHLAVFCIDDEDYFWRTRRGLGKALEKRFFPDLKTVRLLLEERPVSLTEVWEEMIELCGVHCIRLEDMYGQAITLNS